MYQVDTIINRTLPAPISDTSEYDSDDLRNVTKAGMREALRTYAWWKDGVQYVGTTGTTLEMALELWGL